jgi:glycosyltransferase involved in cell wall biosynthesis
VLVSLFNYSNRILDALNSVAQQRQRLLELIVVDDASSDDGAERVTAWMQEQIVADQNPFAMLQLVRHTHNGGLATARNTGFRLAKATWCFVLDADNILYPNALSACLALAEAGPDALAVVHPIIAVEAEPGMVTEQRSLVAGPSWQREILTQGNAVDAMALVRRRAWEAVGGYTHIEGGWEDYDLWCKLIEQGWHGLQCPRVLALYRSHPASMSATVTNSSWPPLRRTLQKRHPWLQLETD